MQKQQQICGCLQSTDKIIQALYKSGAEFYGCSSISNVDMFNLYRVLQFTRFMVEDLLEL